MEIDRVPKNFRRSRVGAQHSPSLGTMYEIRDREFGEEGAGRKGRKRSFICRSRVLPLWGAEIGPAATAVGKVITRTAPNCDVASNLKDPFRLD